MNITEPQFRQLLDRYLAGTASPEEKQVLDDFFETYRHEHVQQSATPNDPDTREEILRLIYQRVGRPTYSNTRGGSMWWKAAAAVTLLATCFYLFREKVLPDTRSQLVLQPIVEQTVRGQKLIFELSDGSKIFLNSSSTLSYPPAFKEDVREVYLTGEAYFEVASDSSKPFIVRTGKTRVNVLGTSFNVRQAKDSVIQVTLVEGKVRLSAETNAVELQPGQQAVVMPDLLTIKTHNVDVSKFTRWKDNILFFENDRLAEAAVVLEDWYDVEITIPSRALNDCLITGEYHNESLDNVLKSFAFLLKAEITRKGEKDIVISGQGCK